MYRNLSSIFILVAPDLCVAASEAYETAEAAPKAREAGRCRNRNRHGDRGDLGAVGSGRG